jgi:6-pyruvoyltetrahydropterin/6-carboxytetrahydropterin synthase
MQRTARITCEFTFEASHQLHRPEWSDAENEAAFGNCARLHGHSYRLRITLGGEVDPETGMVRNFRDLKASVREQVITRLDHAHLNDVLGELTTAENLCWWIATQLWPEYGEQLQRVELWETQSSAAALEADDLALLGRNWPPLRIA